MVGVIGVMWVAHHLVVWIAHPFALVWFALV